MRTPTTERRRPRAPRAGTRGGGGENKSRRYGTLGITYFYATGSLFIASNVVQQTAGYSTGRIPRRLHFLLGLAAPSSSPVKNDQLELLRQELTSRIVRDNTAAPAPSRRTLTHYNYLDFYLAVNTWTILAARSAHTNTNIHSELCTFCVRLSERRCSH